VIAVKLAINRSWKNGKRDLNIREPLEWGSMFMSVARPLPALPFKCIGPVAKLADRSGVSLQLVA
jgi:hypothetical protein